jgi:predicted Zn-dependent protease with MMP-like domain
MNQEEFENIVSQTLAELPEEYGREVENVGIVVESWPTRDDYIQAKTHPQTSLLFGLYTGIPKTKRGDRYNGVLPDRIKIFAGPLMMVSKSLEDLKERIKKTVLHELGHYFGLSDNQIYSAQGH